MRRLGVLNLLLGALLLLCVAANWYVRQPAPQLNVALAQAMARDAGYSSFDPNAHFANRMTMQVPVAGTIARGMPPLGFGSSVVEGIRAGNELTNPVASNDPAALERGRVVYSRYCALCHGADGKGSGPMFKYGIPGPTLHRPFARQMKDGQIFHIVTFGRGFMPAHGSQIPVSDRWKVVLYVRALQQGEASGAPPSAPSSASGNE